MNHFFGPRILIVDDDADFRDAYRTLLADDGYDIDAAANAGEALSRVDEDRWDVILLDKNLRGAPDESGVELATQLRVRAPSARIIMVTGYATDASIRRAFEAGVFDYVEKTAVLGPLLRARLKHALDLARERRLASLGASEVERGIQAAWDAARTETNPNKKGALLEEVLADIVRTVPGFEHVETNRKNEIEEIDILVRNGSADEFWRKSGPYILIECKNWSSVVGVDEASRFIDKLAARHGRASLGFLVAPKGVTGPFKERVRRDTEKNLLVVVLDEADIDALVRANGGRNDLRSASTTAPWSDGQPRAHFVQRSLFAIAMMFGRRRASSSGSFAGWKRPSSPSRGTSTNALGKNAVSSPTRRSNWIAV